MKFKKSKNGQGSIRIIDRKRAIGLLTASVLFCTLNISAQSNPKPPEPPKTTSSKSYSVSVKNSDSESHTSSVSISVSDDSYKFRAQYHKSKNNGVKTILLEQLGENNLKVNGNTYLWRDTNSDDVFECKLSKGQLRIYVDIEAVSKDFVDDIKSLGEHLKEYISGSKSKDEAKSLAKAKRELERAERELERAKREAERAAIAVKRASKN